jgi:demethylmenaquinone methyltransferase/2-methoxy-6-polyprenyl-1,4-benzoquinol methylase
MKNFLFNGNSRINRFFFKQLINWLESSLRYRFNDPQKLVRASGIQAGQSVLEVGCGSGFFTPALSDIVGEQGFVQSVDLHPVAVEATSQKMQTLGKQNVRVSRADAHETDLPDASFDTIVVYGVVPAPVISETRLGPEMYRLLKPGGTLVVWTLAPFWSPKSIMKAAPFTRCDKHQGVHRLQKIAA